MKVNGGSAFNFWNYPFYVGGIVLFFLTNGYSHYVKRISLEQLLLFGILWLALGYAVVYLLKRRFNSWQRAGLFTGYLLVCYLFFGDIHAGFYDVPVLNRFRAVLLLLISGALMLYLFLKKTSNNFTRLTSYLNLVFLVLVLTDCFRIGRASPPAPVTRIQIPIPQAVDKNNKPDIYLVVLDEYAGGPSLQKSFSFDNSDFLSALQKRSFFVAHHSISNYTSTPVSVASIFQMNFIPWSTMKKSITVEDYSDAEREMAGSSLLAFLKDQDYQFENYSIFNIGPDRAKYQPDLLPTQLKLITTKVFHNQLKKHIQVSLEHAHGDASETIAGWFQETYREGNEKLAKLAINTATRPAAKPRFVYLHLLLPHWPYLNDSLGPRKGYNSFLIIPDEADKREYLGYLKFTNRYVLSLMDELKKLTQNNAVIVLISDHGYRRVVGQFAGSGNSNLNATFLPGKNYQGFYDSISNLNQFRVVLNSIFETRLPLLKDSIVY